MENYDITILKDFQDKKLEILFNRALRKNGIKVDSAKRDQIFEDCKSYLQEMFILISRNVDEKADKITCSRSYITGALKKQVDCFFAREKYEFKKKMKLFEYARELPMEKQEMIYIDRTIIDWSEFDFTELSKKELQIVCFMYLGSKSNEWIAKKLNTTVNNIYQIRFRIENKLKNKTNEDLYLDYKSRRDLALFCSAEENELEKHRN